MHRDLLHFAETTKLIDPWTIRIDGKKHMIEDDLSREKQEERLSAILYQQYYVRSPGIANVPSADPITIRDFQSSLVCANSGRGTWEGGWFVEHVAPDGQAVVSHKGIRFWVATEGIRPGADGLAAGSECSVFVPSFYGSLIPGFYLFYGDADRQSSTKSEIVARIYWHLTELAAPTFVEVATKALNSASIPFQMKLLNAPDTYHRADAAVIYLRKADFPTASEYLKTIYLTVQCSLRENVPALTKRLAPGLGVAEDPGDGLSFGQNRCRLLVRALRTAYMAGESSVESRQEVIEAEFSSAGLNSDSPFLSAHEVDCYNITLLSEENRVRTKPGPPTLSFDQATGQTKVNANELLEAAIRIGHELCSQAYWSAEKDRCNWTGRQARGLATTPARVAALGPDLYGGASGIAIFLAELYALTGEKVFCDTANASINCALKQIQEPSCRDELKVPGFFVGTTGLAFAAHFVSHQTGNCSLVEVARKLLDIEFSNEHRDSNDIIEGRAGAILALLAISHQPGWAYCFDWATRLGGELCRYVDSWSNAESGSVVPALGIGFSHGAAGIGLALFELYDRTRESVFCELGRSAFAYEDEQFDPLLGNWRKSRPKHEEHLDFADAPVAWCYGAPGIALSRLRAAEIDVEKRDDYLASARSALDTTRGSLERAITSEKFDISLCHGVTGLIEVLLIGRHILCEPQYECAALDATTKLIRDTGRYSVDARRGGSNPSLMLGTAGVGYQFLRLKEPLEVRSLLLVKTGQ
jgi:hypothetical protein